MGDGDKTSNKVDDLVGKGKEAAGKATGDDELKTRARRTRPRATSSRPARRSRTRSSTDLGPTACATTPDHRSGASRFSGGEKCDVRLG